MSLIMPSNSGAPIDYYQQGNHYQQGDHYNQPANDLQPPSGSIVLPSTQQDDQHVQVGSRALNQAPNFDQNIGTTAVAAVRMAITLLSAGREQPSGGC